MSLRIRSSWPMGFNKTRELCRLIESMGFNKTKPIDMGSNNGKIGCVALKDRKNRKMPSKELRYVK
jgi:hypothetical protein